MIASVQAARNAVTAEVIMFAWKELAGSDAQPSAEELSQLRGITVAFAGPTCQPEVTMLFAWHKKVFACRKAAVCACRRIMMIR